MVSLEGFEEAIQLFRGRKANIRKGVMGCLNSARSLRGITKNAIKGFPVSKDIPQAKKVIPVSYCKLSLYVTEQPRNI